MGTGRPNFVEIPGNILNFIEKNQFRINFTLEIYLIDWSPPVLDQIGYTLLAIEDKQGDYVLEIKHFLQNTSFSPSKSFNVKIEIFLNGVSANIMSFQINK